MLTWTVRLLAVAVTVATLLPLVRRDAWWIRAFDFPRPQLLGAALFLLALVPFTAESAGGRVTLAVALAGSVLLQAARILPFTPLWRRPRSRRDLGRGETVSLLVANVSMTNREADRLIALARELRPDLLLAVETDAWWRRALEPLRGSYPHGLERPQDDTYGLVLLSRLRLDDARVRCLVADDVPSVRCTVATPGGARIAFFGLHPKPPAPQEATATTRRDAELLLVAREAREITGPALVAGDLNDVPWSYVMRLFRRLSGLLDPRVGRGLLPTFPAARPALRFPLDHVFHSKDLELVELCRAPAIGSDHLPLWARFRVAASSAVEPDAPTAGAEDRRHARRKIVAGLAADDRTD